MFKNKMKEMIPIFYFYKAKSMVSSKVIRGIDVLKTVFKYIKDLSKRNMPILYQNSKSSANNRNPKPQQNNK